MKRLLVLPLVLFALLFGAAPASAGPPQEASGEWTYVPTLVGVKQAGPNLFFYGTDIGTWTGTFEGTTTEDFVVVCHPNAGVTFYKGTMEFTGSVDGREGTMILKTNGIQATDTCDPSPAPWSGRWVIIGGTGELADVHGTGTFTGPSLDLDYSGQVHFD
jgi:hypothetical protein